MSFLNTLFWGSLLWMDQFAALMEHFPLPLNLKKKEEDLSSFLKLTLRKPRW
ncbi:hypothetical protein ES703_89238 [subsurface metagenome]